MSDTPITDEVARAIDRLAATWKDGNISPLTFATLSQGELDKLATFERENRELRVMLALAHCGFNMYHDDGELQDSREHPWIDWRRDSVADIQSKLTERALKDPAVRAALAGRPL